MKNESAFWQRCLERGEQLLAPQPRSHTETYRHELKYLISWADKAELTTRMSPVLKLDPHATNGGYFIRSLYFDDYWNTAYEEKDAGVLLRKKYRIRIYNCSDRSIKLERKKKFGSYIYKEAAPLTHAEFDAILAGDYDFLLHSPHRTNVVISLGMVGALSIVRFRTAVKDPLDLLYLFWSITTGITAGAGMYALGLVTAAVMIVMICLFSHWQAKGRVYVAVIHYVGTEAGDDIVRALGRIKYAVKSKTMRGENTEMAVEVFCKDPNMEFADRIRAVKGVQDVTLIQYNGEYHG